MRDCRCIWNLSLGSQNSWSWNAINLTVYHPPARLVWRMSELGLWRNWCGCLSLKHQYLILIGMRLINWWLTYYWHLEATIVVLRLDHSYLLMIRDLKIQYLGLVRSKTWIRINSQTISKLHVIFLLHSLVTNLCLMTLMHIIC